MDRNTVPEMDASDVFASRAFKPPKGYLKSVRPLNPLDPSAPTLVKIKLLPWRVAEINAEEASFMKESIPHDGGQLRVAPNNLDRNQTLKAVLTMPTRQEDNTVSPFADLSQEFQRPVQQRLLIPRHPKRSGEVPLRTWCGLPYRHDYRIFVSLVASIPWGLHRGPSTRTHSRSAARL